MVQFLEDYPLYKKAKLDVDIEYLNDFKSSARPIQKNCLNCGIECTFSLEKINNEYPGTNINYSNDTTSLNYPYLLSYKCAKCSSFKYSFLVLVLEDEDDDTFCVQKIGQNPPYSVQPERPMVKYLDREDLSLYKNGIVCESQGYGVAAFAYYRQITENLIDSILDGLVSMLEDEDSISKIDEAKLQHNAADKINIAKDFVPKALKPEGHNVLGTMYRTLSNGLHSETDEACLDDAMHLRSCLVFVVTALKEQEQSKEDFVTSLNILKSKK